jgi:nucleoside-diphosphate-sugar epimerase
MRKVLVTGGAGYVGSSLVPKLIEAGYEVRILDLFIYGENVFDSIKDKSNLKIFKGDIRDIDLVKSSMKGADDVIHLACISNDPSFELNPKLGKEINFDSFRPLVEASVEAGVSRFIYASSSSVYGVKEVENVTEDMQLEPLTDYSRFKADCEKVLAEYQSESFTTVTVRPATVCGYSPRQRLDVIVNILSNHAFNNQKIKVFGGEQLRPNIHIEDMTDLYVQLLNEDKGKIAGEIFNAGQENFKVKDIADVVKKVIGEDVVIETVSSEDNRSYHISSSKVYDKLGFKARRTIEDAVIDLKKAFDSNKLPNSFKDKKYFNIQTMIESDLK